MSKATSNSQGIGFAGLLTIVFVVLKLTNVIDWRWIWVVSPLWIGLVVGLLFIGIFALIVNSLK